MARGDWHPDTIPAFDLDTWRAEDVHERQERIEALGDSNPPHMAEVIGLMLQAGWSLLLLKLLLIWIFLWFTVPVAGHAVARSALLGGVEPVLAGARARQSAAEADRLEREEGRE